jgi:lysozyme
MLDRDQLERDLIRDEGLKLKPYKDSVGIWTIGVGHNIEAHPLPEGMLVDGKISEADAKALLEGDIDEHVAALDKALPWAQSLDEPRYRALVNMAFNLGIAGLLGFKNTLALIERGEYEKAAANLAMSKWAKQVGPRATRIINIIKGA